MSPNKIGKIFGIFVKIKLKKNDWILYFSRAYLFGEYVCE